MSKKTPKIEKEKFFFPGDAEREAIVIEADSLEEAQELYINSTKK